MRFRNTIEDSTIIKASDIAIRHHKDPQFLYRVSEIRGFNHSSHSGADVAVSILEQNVLMHIKPYKTFNPFSKVIGYASGNTIYCNSRKFDLSLEDRVENLFHESMHLLGYKHKGNSNNEFNRGTVPYKVAEMFKQYCKDIGVL